MSRSLGEELLVSYDLLVFDPAAAPRQRQPFLDWYLQQSETVESHD